MVTLIGLLGAWSLIAPYAADVLVVEKRIENADALLILSGSADHEQRAAAGAAEYKKGVGPMVLITDDGQRGGWDDKEKGNPLFVERIRRKLIAGGVPAEAIVQLPGKVAGTIDEAELLAASAEEHGIKRVALVTSEFHSRRALWTFERVAAARAKGLEVGITIAKPDRRYPDRWTWWLSPRGVRTVAGEYVKFAAYWLFY
ncbi:MAG: YdcF family protein [Pyrinomonadaceae bacterium]